MKSKSKSPNGESVIATFDQVVTKCWTMSNIFDHKRPCNKSVDVWKCTSSHRQAILIWEDDWDAMQKELNELIEFKHITHKIEMRKVHKHAFDAGVSSVKNTLKKR